MLRIKALAPATARSLWAQQGKRTRADDVGGIYPVTPGTYMCANDTNLLDTYGFTAADSLSPHESPAGY